MEHGPMSDGSRIFADAINATQQKKLTRSIDDSIAICGRMADDQEEEMRSLASQGRMDEVLIAELALWRMDQMLDQLKEIRSNAK